MAFLGRIKWEDEDPSRGCPFPLPLETRGRCYATQCLAFEMCETEPLTILSLGNFVCPQGEGGKQRFLGPGDVKVAPQ